MHHANFDSSTPKYNEGVQPSFHTPTDPLANKKYEKQIDALVHEIFTNKKEELAAILEQSQMEAIVEIDREPTILIRDLPAFKQCINNLAKQLESTTPVKSDKQIKKYIQEKFLQEAMPILQWQKQLKELSTLQETLKQETHARALTGKQRKRISKELKETVRTTTLFLEQFGHPECRSVAPELAQVWTAEHLLAKNQLLHSRLEQTDAPASSLKEIKKEYKDLQKFLSEMQKESGASEGKQTGWLTSLAGWFAGGIKRPQTEKDASDFTFIEHYHERIDDLHSRMALLADKFDKLNLSETDDFAIEFRTLHNKVKEYHAHMEFHIDYFTHEAALEAALIDLTDQRDRLMSNNLDFSSTPLIHLRQASEDFGQMIEMHRKKFSNPKILNEIEQKLEFQTQLINHKIEHFLEEFQAEMKAEYYESCAQIQVNGQNKEEMYCLTALHKECTLFIEELEEFMEDFKHYFGDQDLPSIPPLQNLANQMEQAIETLKGQKTREVDPHKLSEIRSQRTVITLDKQKRRWQKEHFEKLEAQEKSLSLVQRLFSTHTAKNAALFYLMQVTPYAKVFAESMNTDVKTPDNPTPMSHSTEESPSLPIFQAATLRLDPTSSEPATSSASHADQAFWMTWPEAASELFSSFTVKSDPLVKKTSTQTVAKSLTDAKIKLQHLQSESFTLGESLSTHPIEATVSQQNPLTQLEGCKEQLNETASSIPTTTSSIPEALEFIRDVEASDQVLRDLQKGIRDLSSPINRNDIHAEDHLKRSPLHLALEDKDIEAAEKLVKRGADILKKDLNSTTPLHLAILSHNSQLLRLMLANRPKKSISLDIEDSQGNTPLHIAIESKNEEAVILLLEAGANPLRESTLNHRVPLFDAVKPGHINLLNLMLPHLPKNKDHDIYGYLLFLAVQEKNPLAIKAVIHQGSNPAKIFMKTTFFHYAVQNNHIDFVKELIGYGLNINDFKNEKNESPLFDAVRENNHEMVKLLLKAQANPNKRNIEGDSPISLASKAGNDQLVSMLTRLIPEVDMIKLLSHSWEVAGRTKLKGKTIELEGSFPQILSPYMMQSINSFAAFHTNIMSQEQRKLIETAIFPVDQWSDAESSSYNPSKVLEAIRANQPIFIPTGWPGHSIEIVVMGSYLMVCNRGEGAKKPIEIFKMDPNSIDEKFLRKLSWKTDKEFNSSFPSMLSQIDAQKDTISLTLENLNPLRPEQIVGNCAWESLETAIFGLLTLKELLEHPEINPETTMKNTHHLLEAWLQFTKLDYLERYLLFSDKEKVDINLLNAIYNIDLRESPETPLNEITPKILNQFSTDHFQYESLKTQYICQNSFLFNPELKPIFPLEVEFQHKFEVLKLEGLQKFAQIFPS